MATFDPITKDLISIGSVDTGQMADIAENITSMRLSLTMDQASELSFSVVDPNFVFASNNYFQIRRDVFYRELIFEIARVEVAKSESVHPEYRLTCYNKNVQMMKRDKKPEAYRGISASDYARTVAKRFNMNSVVQETPKKQSIVKGRSSKSDENVWDVLQRSAADAEFVCFEIDNCLFFCSQTFLLGKWGDPNYQYMGNFFVPFGWPDNDDKAFPGSAQKYILLDMPTFVRSENDPMDAEGTLSVERINGVQLRPGMTINITGIPDFENGYLVTEVSFDEGVPDPVQVSFRTPKKPSAGQKGKTAAENTGGRGAAQSGQTQSLGQLTAQLDPAIVSAIQDHVKSNFVGGQREAERNFLIQQQVAAAVAAAARIYSLPTRDQREAQLLKEYASLGSVKPQSVQPFVLPTPPVKPFIPGNIDLSKRKPVKLPGGEFATVRSVSVNSDGLEVLIPTIGPNGEDWDGDEGLDIAFDHYLATGQHLGKFKTGAEASTYGKWLSEQELIRISTPVQSPAGAGSSALSALRFVASAVLDGPGSPRNTSGFPTNEIISAQANLAAGLIGSDVAARLSLPGVTVAAPQPQSVLIRTLNPPVAGLLPLEVDRTIRTFIARQTLDKRKDTQIRLTNIAIEVATGIYNQVTVEAKQKAFNNFVADSRRSDILRDALRLVRNSLIPQPPSSLNSAGVFDRVINTKIG